MFKKHSKSAGILAAMLILALTMAFTGCSSSTNGSGSGSAGNPNLSGDVSDAAPKTVPSSSESDPVTFDALLSFVNYNYVDTGDESQPKLLRKISTKVKSEKGSEESQIKAVVDALATAPDDGSAAESVVDGRVDINFIKISGDTAVIDVSSSGLDNLSEMDEQFYIYQITDSILNTFSDIKGVRFTVDGTNTDILVSMDISQPFTAESVSEFLNNGNKSDSSSSSDSTVTAQSSQSDVQQQGVVNDEDSGSSDNSGSGVVDDQE